MVYKLGFVGAGVMAGAILSRALDNIAALGILPSDIAVFDPAEDKLTPYISRGVKKAASSDDIFASCETVLLGVKPQYYAEILSKIPLFHNKIVISIMAGVKIATLRKSLPGVSGIVRVMPNMPAQIGKGMSAICFDNVSENDKAFIVKLFESCGKTLVITEDKFDAVTSVSGSGPAYVYLFASGMVKGGIAGGLTEEESRLLALQTIEGAAALAAASPDFTLDTLVDRVCSKGGTTIEAVNLYREHHLPEMIGKGIEACREKSKLLSEKY